MITRNATRNGARVTFSVASTSPVSVVGDFNGWDPDAHPLRGRAEGVRSVTVTLKPGAYAFRYLAHGGLFFDDPDADRFDANAHGGIDGVVVVAEAAAKAQKATPKKAGAKKATPKKAGAKDAPPKTKAPPKQAPARDVRP